MSKLIAAIPYPSFNPVLLRLGPLAVHWYGIAYVLGFLFAYGLLRRMIRTEQLRLTRDALSDLMGFLILGVLAGGRIGWWVFYHRRDGIEPWYEPLAMWHGGMSFHGGLIGVAIVLAVWSWRRRESFWNLTDAAALVTPIGLFFGRLANFINAELVGRPTDLPWGVVFPGESIARHPSQLYEAALEGPILMATLWAARKLSQRDGQIAALFLVFYGLFRFDVEFTREPDAQLGFIAFGWLTMGQVLSVALVAVGLIVWTIRGRPALGRPERAEALACPPGARS